MNKVIGKSGALLAIFMVAIMLLPAVGAYVPPEAITGRVTDTFTGQPIANALVTDLTTGGSDYTDAGGYYGIGVSVGGTHTIRVVKSGYTTLTGTVTVSTRTGFGTKNFAMYPTDGIWGYLRDQNNNVLANTCVYLGCYCTNIYDYTDSLGRYYIDGYYLSPGVCELWLPERASCFEVQGWRLTYSGSLMQKDLKYEANKYAWSTVFVAYMDKWTPGVNFDLMTC